MVSATAATAHNPGRQVGDASERLTVKLRLGPRAALWVAAFAAFAATVAALTLSLRAEPFPAQDRAVLRWVSENVPDHIGAALTGVTATTDRWPAAVIATGTFVILWVTRRRKDAALFAVVCGTVAVGAHLTDHILGGVVGRSRPSGSELAPSYPSGHVFGSVLFYGFLGFLAVHRRLRKRYLFPALAAVTAMVLAVGVSRIYLHAHWPSDVAAAYLLGAMGLMVMVPVVRWLDRTRWLSAPRPGTDLPVAISDRQRTASSFTSLVVLDEEHGTATKFYRPPALARVIYWLSFQASFPYERNMSALKTAAHRRKIASLLTRLQFGRDLVAPVVGLESGSNVPCLVTRFVPGQPARNDDRARGFLAEVSDMFASAGLAVWQVNPSNPHAHTNLIQEPGGDYVIIDLESGFATPFPGRGQLVSALRTGAVPVFDDIDFARLRAFAAANRAGFEQRLGRQAVQELDATIDECEASYRDWKDSEPRLWGRLTRLLFRLATAVGGWPSRVRRAVTDADRASAAFVAKGIDRWESQGRLNAEEAGSLRTKLATPDAQRALKHMGVHLVLSALLRFPIGSIARFGWTLGAWLVSLVMRFRQTRRDAGSTRGNIHTPAVLLLSLLPGFGAVAYLAAGPLRNKLLIRIMADQVAHKLPFRLYSRLRLERWLARPVRDYSGQQAAAPVGIVPAQASAQIADRHGPPSGMTGPVAIVSGRGFGAGTTAGAGAVLATPLALLLGALVVSARIGRGWQDRRLSAFASGRCSGGSRGPPRRSGSRRAHRWPSVLQERTRMLRS
ncbi:MAG: phosphatase PAP2 family protein [Chloroflexi bacterium]|nr:phosphatase PAP2 family protein [Chloroflexota bacterium]